MDWKPLDTCPYGKTLVVSRNGWEGMTTVFWKDEVAKRLDLRTWSDPPTHYLDNVPPVPALPA